MDDPTRENVNHKHSAIFIGLRNKRPAPSLPPLQIGEEGQQQPPRQSAQYNDQRGSVDDGGQWTMPLSPLSSQGHQRPASMDVGAMRKVPRARNVSFSAMSGQSLDRAHSVHLEHLDNEDQGSVYEARNSTDEQYDAALRDSERVRRMAEGGEGDEQHQRRSSIAALSMQDDWGPDRPVMVSMPDDGYGRQHRSSSSMSGGAAARRASMYDPEANEEELLRNPFEIPTPASEGGSSRFDTGGPQRRVSLVYDDAAPDLPPLMYSERRSSLEYGNTNRLSMMQGAEEYEDIPDAADYGRPLRPSKYTSQVLRVKRHELLRPKTLLMPPQLAGTERQTISVHVPDGFTMGEKPLPTDARASILNMGVGVPLSLSQRTFRSSLMVGGQRDDDFFRGQAEEGEELRGEDDDPEEGSRKPGKLYGTSLIDQLEARKDLLHNKKRVFYGDNRPSMMNRQSTLLEVTPPADYDGAAGNGPPAATVGQRPLTTFGSVPQLNLPDEQPGSLGRSVRSKSVFGTDTVWEREMTKLNAMQESERLAKEQADAAQLDKERLKIEKMNNRRSMFGGGRKSQMIHPADLNMEFEGGDARRPKSMMAMVEAEANQRHSISSERPPTVMYEPEQGAPRLSYEPEQPKPATERRPASSLGVGKWFAESESDDSDDNTPLRAAKGKARSSPQVQSPISPVGSSSSPATKRVSTIRAVLPAMQFENNGNDDDDSSDEEPLSRVKAKVAQDDSDEEVPLSQLRGGATSGGGTIKMVSSQNRSAPALPNIKTDGIDIGSLGLEASGMSPAVRSAPAAGVDDDDDEPLFLRKVRNRAAAQSPEKPAASGVQNPEEVEDDLPLAWKHAGAAQKQQHVKAEHAQRTAQSMMMPNMGYGASPYMSTYGMPQMGMPMGMPQMAMGMGMPMPVVPPGMPAYDAPDPGSNIDSWRKQVAGGIGTGGGGGVASAAQTVSDHP